MLRPLFYTLLALFALAVVATAALLARVAPQLPDINSLKEVKLQMPMRVFTADGSLIGEFGEKRRNPVAIDEVPLQLKQAFIAAEDERFYEHPGVDWMAIVRAAVELLKSHQKRQGGSTITMQVARNFFLSSEKTFDRKLREIMLAIKIERELRKDEILELYLNKIFLGQRAYGVGAAALVYYGKPLAKLTLAESAMIAGLPKAPSSLNPVADRAASLARRGYVLRRMLELEFVSREAFDQAMASPETASLHGQPSETDAPYLAEMVRTAMEERYGTAAYTEGFRVYTTVTKPLQDAAVRSLRTGLSDYDRRHGYRGPEAQLALPVNAPTQWPSLLAPYQTIGGLPAALVTAVSTQSVTAMTAAGESIEIPWSGLVWARPQRGNDAVGAAPRTASEILKTGDVIRIQYHVPVPAKGKPAAEPYWRLAQLPVVEGALVSLAVADGAVQSLVGGFDFARSKFNRVTQAMRQPGSNFKPFVYSAALDHGFTPASFVNDAPIVFDAPGLESVWRPENYTGTYYGPTRLRDALANSRNLVSIRLMRELGVETVISHVSRFGFDAKSLPQNLSLALGTGETTPLTIVSAYAAFANGGFRITPYFILRVEGPDGRVLETAAPVRACDECTDGTAAEEEPLDIDDLKQQQAKPAAPRAIDAQNAFMMYSMMKDVITRGTARRATQLNRKDLAGKTGTTNDQKDAWFSGFNGKIVTTVWVGFDIVKPLGGQETGARAALPVWIDYMREALQDTPETELVPPPGIVTVRIDPDSGAVAGVSSKGAVLESFRERDVPGSNGAGSAGGQAPQDEAPPADAEQLF